MLPGVSSGVTVDFQPGFIFWVRQGLIMLIYKTILDKYTTLKLKRQKYRILCLFWTNRMSLAAVMEVFKSGQEGYSRDNCVNVYLVEFMESCENCTHGVYLTE